MNLKDLVKYLPFIQAASEGKAIEIQGASGAYYPLMTQESILDYSSTKLRIKPTPTLRPWTAEEAQQYVGCKIRNVTNGYVGLFVGCVDGCCWSASRDGITLEMAFKQWKRFDDHGKTWLPCGVEVKEIKI